MSVKKMLTSFRPSLDQPPFEDWADGHRLGHVSSWGREQSAVVAVVALVVGQTSPPGRGGAAAPAGGGGGRAAVDGGSGIRVSTSCRDLERDIGRLYLAEDIRERARRSHVQRGLVGEDMGLDLAHDDLVDVGQECALFGSISVACIHIHSWTCTHIRS